MMTGLTVLVALSFVALVCESKDKTGLAIAYSASLIAMVAYQIWCELPR